MSCTECFKGSVHTYAQPQGTIQPVYGVRTYIAGRTASGLDASKPTIIFLTDVFCLNLPNNKLLADYFANRTGFNVLVPEVVPAGGVPVYMLSAMEAFTAPVKWWNLLGQVARVYYGVRVMYYFYPLLFGAKKATATILDFARDVKNSTAGGNKLGVAGYCWGGLEALKLSKQPVVEGGQEGLINAVYTAHPSSTKVPQDYVEAVGNFSVPFSLAIGDLDFGLSMAQVDEIEAALRENVGHKTPYELIRYPGCRHGFAIRVNREREFEDKAANQAANQAVEWFKKFLS